MGVECGYDRGKGEGSCINSIQYYISSFNLDYISDNIIFTLYQGESVT